MTHLEVVTLLIPREPRWVEYLPLLELQRRTAERVGHRHVVVTEGAPPELEGYNTLPATMRPSLMHAILEGQIAYLMQWSGEHPVVLVDVDCLINRDLTTAFSGLFDIGITSRPNPNSPVNNGAMYIAKGAKRHALKFFTRALALCKEHWGGDQEAIAQAAAPIPLQHSIASRHGAQIAYLPMNTYNCAPQRKGAHHESNPYVIHFKGTTKEWMATYAEMYLL